MNIKQVIKCDLYRVSGGGNTLKHVLFEPEFKYVAIYRITHEVLSKNSWKLTKIFWRMILKSASIRYGYEIAPECHIAPGLRLVHRCGICINPEAIIGSNVTIFHGATIGATRRGGKKGSPIIGNNVWIGSNAVVVGRISVGDDVLIAPNSYINMDIPSHSICVGNPATIISRLNATEGYLDNVCKEQSS